MKNELSEWYVASIGCPEPLNTISGYVYRGWTPCIEWCEITYGQMTMDNYVWRFVGDGVFEFKRAEDRTMFLLRWL